MERRLTTHQVCNKISAETLDRRVEPPSHRGSGIQRGSLNRGMSSDGTTGRRPVLDKEGCMTAESHDSDSRTPTRCVRLLKVLVVDKDTVFGPAIRLALEEAGYYL